MKDLEHIVAAVLIGLFFPWTGSGAAVAEEIGYVEDFALAADRTVALRQLVPGTEEFYYYHGLHYQNTGELDRVEPLVQAWIHRHQVTPRVREIQNRQALLMFRSQPDQTLDYLQRTLNLQFHHQRETAGPRPDLPSRLDPSLLDPERLTQEALRTHENLDGFEDSVLESLMARELTPARLRQLLERLTRPDHPLLVPLVVADLGQPDSAGFGTLAIHRMLLLDQLDACLALKPDLLNQTEFVQTYLAKLQPNDDVDLRTDVVAEQAQVERLWSFAERLAPAHNSLKAHLFHHRLRFDLRQGLYDQPRFMAYIALPRLAPYVNPRYVEPEPMRRVVADLQADFAALTRLPPVMDDEPLIRAYLQHFFLTDTTYKAYEPYLNDVYLKHLFAETKLVHGVGDAEQWSALLPPELFQALKQRVDLDFAPASRRQFAAEDPIEVELFVKNVPTLIVKVFEINTFNHYRQTLSEVNTDINLDGLVPNQEQTYQYDEPELRRVARRFEFPELDRPGVYVIDFIGGGKSSRAVIRKGRLHYVARTSTAGHLFTLFDDQHTPLTGAALWMAGREYGSDEQGTIRVPFSTQPARQPIVLRHGEFAQLDAFEHQAEDYQLAAGIYVDRESLLARRRAAVLLRPALYLNGTPVTLSVLEDARLTITSIDHDGISTTREIADLTVTEDREIVQEFQVPPRLSVLQFTLKGNVWNVSQNRKVELATAEVFRLNGIDRTDKIEDLHLTSLDGQYVLEVLGRTGEPRAHRPVQLTIKQRDFRQAVHVTLQADADGRIELGELPRVAQLTAVGPQEIPRTWLLRGDRQTRMSTMHAVEGTSFELPCSGVGDEPSRAEFSLLELRGDQFVADHFDSLRRTPGTLKVAQLPRGDYDLLFKETGERIRFRIAAGSVRDQYVLGPKRHLELRGHDRLRIERVALTPEQLEIQLAPSGPFTRVHLFATRYEPASWVYDHLGRIGDREPGWTQLGSRDSAYAAGRILGDEYRYIIDRKYAAKYPGIMLPRPSLVLNPWATSRTETTQQAPQEGESFAPEAPAAESRPMGRAADRAEEVEQAQGANLDFLAHASAVLVNLAPDDQGLVTIDRRQLAHFQRVWIVAVDPRDTVCRTVSLPESARQVVDLRLAQGLDPQQHFTQQKRITVLDTSETLHLENAAAARFETYDSLAKVLGLMITLSQDATLAEFGFISDWDRLTQEQKREKYSQYACHELNFFLFRKDPEFFQAVVLPYLRNKHHKTFLDDWLIGNDLRPHLEPWRYARLNVVEKILLGQRVDEETPRARELVEHLYDLIPVDLDRFRRLFETAVQGSALQVDDVLSETLGLRDEERSERLRRRIAAEVEQPELAAADAGPAAGFGVAGAAAGRVDKSLVPAEKDAAPTDAAQPVPFFSQDRLGEDLGRRLFLDLDKTREWAENNYYQVPLAQQLAGLVEVNAFWRDYARHAPDRPFRSIHVAEATANFTEMMFALSVLDLPFRSTDQEVEFDQSGLTLTAKSPGIVFHEDIRVTERSEGETPILVSQNYFRLDDRYRYVNQQQYDKYVTDEFLVQTVYGCQIVVTNPTSSPQKLSLLLQVPLGALPVLNGQWTRSADLDLNPFDTKTIEYHFYFPFPGLFVHYPVQVAKDERVLAAVEVTQLLAVAELSEVDRRSWQYVSQSGSDEELLEYLRTENLHRVDLEKIAHRMHDREFFQSVTAVLASRHLYHHTLWSYAIKHNLPESIRVFLEHDEGFVRACGARIDSPLLTIDPVTRGTFQHLDYRPLVNARAHRLGARRHIVNDRLLSQYHDLLTVLSYHDRLSDEQLMAVTYYLLLQDRFEEALAFFRRVDPERLATRLQYDYFTAYLDFLNADPQIAGAIAEQYVDYPVDRWRDAFREIAQQLAEIRGDESRVVDARDRDQAQAALAARQPSFEFQVESKRLSIQYQNLTQVRVNYYHMDIELLFSRNPFVQQYSGQFSTIRPNLSTTVELPEDRASIDVDLPEELENRNVLVEVTGEGRTRSQAYYANSLSVQLLEEYGQIRVVHQETLQPLATVYVKVYARRDDGTVQFYRDGYTDLRGRFDYASLSTNELDHVERFALLILSEQQGAVVREADPPKR